MLFCIMMFFLQPSYMQSTDFRKSVRLAQIVKQWTGNPDASGSRPCLITNFPNGFALISFIKPDVRKILNKIVSSLTEKLFEVK